MRTLFITLIFSSFLFSFNALYTKAFIAYKKGQKYLKSNPQKAQKYFQESFLLLNQIKKDSAQKFYLLGEMYLNGWGVAQDLEEAEKMLKKAISLGNKRAYCSIAKLYIKENKNELAQKYLKSAKKNSIACNLN